MMTKLFLKPYHLSLASISPKFLFVCLPRLSLLHLSPVASSSSSSCSNHPQFPESNLICYGPSLQKGTKPPQVLLGRSSDEDEDGDGIVDEESFTRAFDIAALRVPSKDCFALESKLRGHLLNWPRVRNIARVPGDEVDPEVAEILGPQNDGDEDREEGSLVPLQRRIYGKAEGDGDVLSPVLYRDKLAKTFNSRGFVKFRNLAKISRPKRKKRRGEENVEGDKRIHKKDFAVVEVIEDEEEESEGLKNLLGEGFRSSKWKGSTRLLLLDERYANRGVDELPEAIKVAAPSL